MQLTADATDRRHIPPPSVNAPAAVDLQTCRGDLHDARLTAADAARIADAGRQLAARLAQQQQRLASSLQASVSAQRNLLVTVPFASGSTRVALPEADAGRIVDETRAAPLVVLRGRTDGRVDSLLRGANARSRSLAVADWLMRSGVEHTRIRTTWQPVGDHAVDNATSGGRALNRRVEIEIYRSALPLGPDRHRARRAAGRDADACRRREVMNRREREPHGQPSLPEPPRPYGRARDVTHRIADQKRHEGAEIAEQSAD